MAKKLWALDGTKKPQVHVPAIGVEYNVKTTLWYERKGETPPPGTPLPGTVTEDMTPDDVFRSDRDVKRIR